jgi:hypothetical protein
MNGQKIGPYEVVVKLGAGGMGEVYRARDTRLQRDVALKTLPRTVASDPERLARFTREAQLLAALNHPNIAAIHGLEERSALVARRHPCRGRGPIGRVDTGADTIAVVTGQSRHGEREDRETPGQRLPSYGHEPAARGCRCEDDRPVMKREGTKDPQRGPALTVVQNSGRNPRTGHE